MIAFHWSFTILFVTLIVMVRKGYKKEYRKVFFTILFQMGIIRLSIPLLDTENRNNDMEMFDLIILTVCQIMFFNMLFLLAAEVNVNFKLLIANTVIVCVATTIGIFNLAEMAHTPSEIAVAIYENLGMFLFLLTFFLMFTCCAKSIQYIDMYLILRSVYEKNIL